MQINDEADFTSENENTVNSAKDLSLPANPESRWGAADFSLGRVAGEALKKLDEATKQWLDEVVDKLADAERVSYGATASPIRLRLNFPTLVDHRQQLWYLMIFCATHCGPSGGEADGCGADKSSATSISYMSPLTCHRAFLVLTKATLLFSLIVCLLRR